MEEIDPAYGRIAWYTGVIGFILFFIYKFRILRGRARIIRTGNLHQKLAEGSGLSRGDYRLLSEMVCSQDNWKERANFFVIFLLSGLALILAVYLDFFG